MKRSTDRILTTHAGSLPRPNDLLQTIRAKARGEKVDEAALGKRVREAVTEVVRKQVDTGIDVIDDGEFGKPSFVTYVRDRLGGLEPSGTRPNAWLSSREAISFPDYYKAQEAASPRAKQVQMACTTPLTYKGQAALKTDLDNLKDALKGVEPGRCVRAVHLAGQHRGLERKQILQDRRGIPDRDRRRDERRIQGDRRCGLPGAGRRSAARQLLPDGARRCRSTTSANGRCGGSRRSITRCAASRPRKSATTPATASTWARACTTSRSGTSSTSCRRSAPAPSRSKPPIRAMSTNGRCGRRRSCRRARC